MKVSVIIPSHNKRSQLSRTIVTLEKQTYPNFEVVIIDDSSTDGTSMINLPARFKMIRNATNLGRARTRNIGIEQSDGELIVFLDAEMLVRPNFIARHVEKHVKIENLVLTGAMYFYCLSENDQHLKPFSLDFERKIYLQNYFYREIIRHYGNDLKDLHFPWIACLTGNVSFKRELLDQAGHFDENFTGYGWEDWELGYRLWQHGGIFKVDREVASIHQNHPVSKSNGDEAMENYARFRDKHSSLDVNAMSLELIRKRFSLKEINEFLQAYYSYNNEEHKKALYELVEENAYSLTRKEGFAFNPSVKIRTSDLPNGILQKVFRVLEEIHIG